MRLLLVDDHRELIEPLREYFEHHAPGFEVVGVVFDGLSAVQAVQERRPDVVLLDRHLPGLDRDELIRLLCQMCPECRILIFTACDDPVCLEAALQAGAAGVYMKGSGVFDDLAKAIELTHKGMRVVAPDWLLSPAFTKQGGAKDHVWASLTAAELRAIELAWEEEMDNRSLAKALKTTPGGFANMRGRIKEKLGVPSWNQVLIQYGKHRLRDRDNHQPK